MIVLLEPVQSGWLLSQLKIRKRKREIVQSMGSGDSSLRTGSIWLAFVTGENASASQKCFITFHIVGWGILKMSP